MVYCMRLINGYHSSLHGLLRETDKRLSFEITWFTAEKNGYHSSLLGLLHEIDKRLSFDFTWFTA